MLFSSRSYAIGMAHYQIAGGTRTLAAVMAGYAVLAGVLIGLGVHSEGWPLPARSAAGMFTFVLVIESFLLIMFGSMRIGNCIRMDVSSGMIESHRLMPLSAWRAILGYLLGTTVHVIGITAINVVLLMGLGAMAGVNFSDLVICQMVLAFFALFIWSFSAMGSLMFKQMMPLIVLGSVFGSAGSVVLRNNAILPGASILASPFLGETIYSITRRSPMLRGIYALSLGSQIALIVLFFIGACRRYRGTYVTTFSPILGLALCGVWSILSVFSIRYWGDFFREGGRSIRRRWRCRWWRRWWSRRLSRSCRCTRWWSFRSGGG